MKPYQVISYKSIRTHTGAKPRGKFAKIPIANDPILSMNCIQLIIFKFVKIIWFLFLLNFFCPFYFNFFKNIKQIIDKITDRLSSLESFR